MAGDQYAAINLLTQMLVGINSPSFARGDEPDLSLDEIEGDQHAVRTTVTLPSGDRYRICVEWLKEESP